jgi:succinate dehydrogenase / fumarate reductase flavoprotein subunit
MQGLADGYFVLPATMAGYLATQNPAKRPAPDHAAFNEAEARVQNSTKQLLNSKGQRTPDSFHKELGRIMWEDCGMARNKAGLEKGIKAIAALREEYWRNVNVLGDGAEWNQSLEKAGRLADFMELGELMCRDALMREESCGGHFREEYQYTKDDPETKQGLVNPGDVKRRDDQFAFVAAWEYAGEGKEPVLNKEPLVYEEVKMSTRSYK